MWKQRVNCIGFGELLISLQKKRGNGQVISIHLDTLDSIEQDKAQVTALLDQLLKHHHVTANLEEWDDSIFELMRAGQVELHNMAAILGGMASQEIIKLVTRQYVPMNNTLLFDGEHSTSVVLEA